MIVGTSVDWTQVLLAAVAIIPACIAAVGVLLVRGAIQTPSGDPIGKVAERTHDLSAVDVKMTQDIHKHVVHRMDGTQPAPRERKDD